MKHTDNTWTKEYDLKANFKYCLDRGKEGEKYITKVLGGEYKIEAKTDFLCKDTGNVFIEFKSRGKDSGIKTTTADFWVFVLPKNQDDFPIMIFVHLSKLKNLIKNKKYKVVNGGDAMTSKGYLVPKEDLIQLNN